MHNDREQPLTDWLFRAEIFDLRVEMMTYGVLIPLMVIGQAGLLASYQKPWLDNLDLRIPTIYTLAFLLGVVCALLSHSRARFSLWLSSWGALGVAALLFISGQDGYTATGLCVACVIVTMLLGPRMGWLALALSTGGLVAVASTQPELALWPTRVLVVIITSAFLVILAQVVSRVLFRALQWTQDNYELARRQTDALTEQSAQLELTLKSLSQTSFQLARANEQMEVAMQYAEDARQSKQQFAAAVSHELRAPLNLIIGFSDLILNEPGNYHDTRTGLSPKLLADIRVVNNHAQHLLKLVNDILDLSQLDVNYLTVSRASVQIRDVILAAVNDYAYLIEQRSLKLHIDIEPNLPLVMADTTRIRQVLLNLLNNALRFTDKGSITVRAQLSEAEEHRNGDQPEPGSDVPPASTHIVISVSDTGVGIAPADLKRIFEPFVQVGDAKRHTSAGSGLGLTISKRFVELHDGHMWVDSALGGGSTFFFTLPCELGGAPSTTWRSPHEFMRREVGPLVVVERTAVLSRLLERRIKGMRVESVNSIDALYGSKEYSPEVVLINEPVDSSIALLPLTDKLRRIPVLRCYVHGALALPALDDESPVNHNHHYLVKPVSRDKLYQILAQMLAAGKDGESDATERPARILVVDDEEDAAYLLARMLRLAPAGSLQGYKGVNVVRARSGEQALEQLHELSQPGGQPIDAVLLDLVLGGLGSVSGYAVLAEMERCDYLRDIPVCVVTGQVVSGELLVTPYLAFTREDGLSARELAEAVVSLTRIALPGVDVSAQ